MNSRDTPHPLLIGCLLKKVVVVENFFLDDQIWTESLGHTIVKIKRSEGRRSSKFLEVRPNTS